MDMNPDLDLDHGRITYEYRHREHDTIGQVGHK